MEALESRIETLESRIGDEPNIASRIVKSSSALAAIQSKYDIEAFITGKQKLLNDFESIVEEILAMEDVYTETYIPLLKELNELKGVLDEKLQLDPEKCLELEKVTNEQRQEYEKLSGMLDSWLDAYHSALNEVNETFLQLNTLYSQG